MSQCFESVKRLKLLEPDVLCEALRHFPDDLTNGGVVLPDDTRRMGNHPMMLSSGC